MAEVSSPQREGAQRKSKSEQPHSKSESNLKGKNKIISVVSGKRKTAVAKVKIISGGDEVTFNYLPINTLPLFHKLSLLEPIRIYERIIKQPLTHTLQIKTKSGGKEAQIQAARLALAKALLEITKSEELKKAFLAYDRNLIVPDFRRKEAYKPGDSKARAKRQKSYR